MAAVVRGRGARAATLPGLEPAFTAVPGTPFGVVPAADGRHAFVTLPGRNGSAVALLARGRDERMQLVRSISLPVPGLPRGLASDRSGRYLVVAATADLVVIDTPALLDGGRDPVVAQLAGGGGQFVQVALTRDDRHAFVTDEENASLSVFDLGDSLASETPGGELVSHVHVSPGPTGCALSADGRHIFVASQMDAVAGSRGDLSVVDVTLAIGSPRDAVVARSPAGKSLVRVAVSPAGDAVWATDRGGDALLGFETASLVAGNAAPAANVHVGPAPVGLALVGGGSFAVVANSNRFHGGDRPQTLAVVDTRAALAGEKQARVGTIPAGVFPREVAAMPDDQTVVVTNFGSRSVETVSLAGLGLPQPPSR